jgi:single-strand DNA-binding protein
MNKIIIIGHLTKEPQKVDNQDLCKLVVAVKNNFKNQDGEYGSEFFNVAVWNKLHENCMKYLNKGSKVAIIGEHRHRFYEKDGVRKSVCEIVAHEIDFLSTPKKEDDEPKYIPIDENDIFN